MSHLKNIVSIVGARPQFIKAAPFSRALTKARVDEFSIHTGQHYDQAMSQVFFDELGIRKPDVNLNVGSATHALQTARMLEGIEPIILKVRPSAVAVFGDTNSTLAGALAAAKLNVPVVHIEAGLRSFDRTMPEEVNRVVTDHLSSLLFAPTETAVENLRLEGVPDSSVVRSGDVMYDAALMFKEAARRLSPNANRGAYVLATIHRASNTDSPRRLSACFSALAQISRRLPVLLPLHPRTQAIAESEGLMQSLSPNVEVLGPVGYLEMLQLIQGAAVVATDSGGLQKEAFFFRVPCVTLRENTEWIELVEAGWNTLCSSSEPALIEKAVLEAIGTRGREVQPYGVGNAADEMVAQMQARL
jgi:UDP-GlcNAc3NAcA epimerase